MTAFLAAVPLAIVMVAMGGLRWSAAASGAIGLVSALALALAFLRLQSVAHVTGNAHGQTVATAGETGMHGEAPA